MSALMACWEVLEHQQVLHGVLRKGLEGSLDLHGVMKVICLTNLRTGTLQFSGFVTMDYTSAVTENSTFHHTPLNSVHPFTPITPDHGNRSSDIKCYLPTSNPIQLISQIVFV